MRRDPFHGPLVSWIVALAYFMLEQYAEALTICRDFVDRAPNRPWGYALQAMISAELGQIDEAHAMAGEVVRLDPRFTVSGTARTLVAFKGAADDKRFFDALRRAGLPE